LKFFNYTIALLIFAVSPNYARADEGIKKGTFVKFKSTQVPQRNDTTVGQVLVVYDNNTADIRAPLFGEPTKNYFDAEKVPYADIQVEVKSYKTSDGKEAKARDVVVLSKDKETGKITRADKIVRVFQDGSYLSERELKEANVLSRSTPLCVYNVSEALDVIHAVDSVVIYEKPAVIVGHSVLMTRFNSNIEGTTDLAKVIEAYDDGSADVTMIQPDAFGQPTEFKYDRIPRQNIDVEVPMWQNTNGDIILKGDQVVTKNGKTQTVARMFSSGVFLTPYDVNFLLGRDIFHRNLEFQDDSRKLTEIQRVIPLAHEAHESGQPSCAEILNARKKALEAGESFG